MNTDEASTNDKKPSVQPGAQQQPGANSDAQLQPSANSVAKKQPDAKSVVQEEPDAKQGPDTISDEKPAARGNTQQQKKPAANPSAKQGQQPSASSSTQQKKKPAAGPRAQQKQKTVAKPGVKRRKKKSNVRLRVQQRRTGRALSKKGFDLVAPFALVLLIIFIIATPFCSQRETVPEQAVEQTESVDNKSAEKEPVEEEPVNSERDEYIAAWAARIDTYNAGYPLEGYGATFAAAAYDYGVDPRYSPAIARVESGSGISCFLPCNAWGWGSYSWSDWDTAIYAHVQGLATSYSTTLTYEDALKYNSANADEWYAQVEANMALI